MLVGENPAFSRRQMGFQISSKIPIQLNQVQLPDLGQDEAGQCSETGPHLDHHIRRAEAASLDNPLSGPRLAQEVLPEALPRAQPAAAKILLWRNKHNGSWLMVLGSRLSVLTHFDSSLFTLFTLHHRENASRARGCGQKPERFQTV